MDDAQNYLRERAADIRSKGHTLTAEMHENIADYISRLEAVVRAGDLLIEKINDCNADDDFRNAAYLSGLWHRTGTFKETRSRVTLPPLTQTNQAKDGDKDASRLPQGTTAFRLPSTADAERAKERERLIADVVAAVGRWNNNYTVSALEVIRAADALAAFDADNGGSKKSNPTDAAELERLRGVEDEAADAFDRRLEEEQDGSYSIPVNEWSRWRSAREARIAFEAKIGGGK